jgi:hypothetical protein
MNAIKNCLIAALLIASLVQWARLESLTKSRSDALRQLELNLAKQPTQGDRSVAGKLLLKEHHDFDFYNAQTIVAWMPQTGLGTILLPRDPVRALSKYGISHWAWAIRGVKAKGRKLLAERLGRLCRHYFVQNRRRCQVDYTFFNHPGNRSESDLPQLQ